MTVIMAANWPTVTRIQTNSNVVGVSLTFSRSRWFDDVQCFSLSVSWPFRPSTWLRFTFVKGCHVDGRVRQLMRKSTLRNFARCCATIKTATWCTIGYIECLVEHTSVYIHQEVELITDYRLSSVSVLNLSMAHKRKWYTDLCTYVVCVWRRIAVDTAERPTRADKPRTMPPINICIYIHVTYSFIDEVDKTQLHMYRTERSCTNPTQSNYRITRIGLLWSPARCLTVQPSLKIN